MREARFPLGEGAARFHRSCTGTVGLGDPLALLPLAAAAGGGRVGAFEAQQLVAAGLTLLRRCAPLVRALSGRRAAILLPTCPAYLTALAASEGRGAVLIDPLAAPPEIAYQLADAGVGACFTNLALARKLPADLPRALLDDVPRSARFLSAGEQRDVDLGSHFGFPLEGEPSIPGRDEEAVIVYTSAMAGVPLGAILTHRGLLANARATLHASGLAPGDQTLAALPFAHLFGLVVTLLAPLLAGGHVRTLARFAPASIAELFERGAVAKVAGVPAMYDALTREITRRGAGVGALDLCICGGAPLAREAQDRWATLTGVELRQGYGLVEAGPVCLFNDVQQPNRRGTLGLPLPGMQVAIRAEDRPATLPPGVTGEICVSGESVFAGYVTRGGSEPRGLVREGAWLRTGDLGSADADGVVTFRGVRTAMFTRNGFTIYPREIERVVMQLPGVRAARVRAIPRPAREHDIALDVAGDVAADTVRRWCVANLSAYKQPAQVTII